MNKYRKKPVVVEAMSVSESDPVELSQWLETNLYPYLVGNALEPETLRYHDQVDGDNTRPDKGHYVDPASGKLVIRTLEGDMKAYYTDMIIKGVAGEFYPCDRGIFDSTYEPA